jgi:hypothetical protein
LHARGGMHLHLLTAAALQGPLHRQFLMLQLLLAAGAFCWVKSNIFVHHYAIFNLS